MNDVQCEAPMPPQGLATTALGGLDRIDRPQIDCIIRKVENGFVVVMGCKNFIAKTLSEIFDGLTLYYQNPDEAIKKYCSK